MTSRRNWKKHGKVFIAYILLELDLQDSKVLTRQKGLSILVDNNSSWRLKLSSGI